MLKHKGYIGVANIDTETDMIYGEVINTRDVITFQATCVADLRAAFIDSVEDYLEFCAERGEDPEKPFSGNYGLRMDPKVHEEASYRAKLAGQSLNEWINNAIVNELKLDS
jgi:predicted HicB family RNase H-like nuclease